MTLLNQLAAIRTAQGKDPIDSSHIEGFGPGSPPPPPYNPGTPAFPTGWVEDDPDADLDEAPAPPMPSPLVPRKAPAPPPKSQLLPTDPVTGLSEQDLAAILANQLKPELMVMDRVAEVKGRVVNLSEKDAADIRRVVLLALRREVDAELGDATPRRKARRSPVGGAEGSAGVTALPGPETSPAAPQAPRKRGRPRGSLLAPRTP